MRTRVGLWAVVAIFVAACGSGGGFDVDPDVAPGINPYTFTWDETADGETVSRDREYLLYVPQEYLDDPDDPWPLVLSLHGYPGPNEVEGLTSYGVPAVVQSTPYRFIMAAPLATNADFHRPGWAWLHSADHLVDFIDHVRSRVSIDPNRIYVTGYSWGTTGAWALAAAHPDLPAVLVTVAGGWNDRCPNCEWPAEDYAGQYPENICDLKDIPTWAFHGDLDRVIPWQASQVIVDALQACGGDVRFTLQEGVRHRAVAYEDPALYEWMLAQGTDEPWPLLHNE